MEILGLLGLLFLSVVILGISMEAGDRKNAKLIQSSLASLNTYDEQWKAAMLKNMFSDRDYVSTLNNKLQETQKQLDTVTKQLNDITVSLLEKKQKVQYNVKISPKPKVKKKPVKKVK